MLAKVVVSAISIILVIGVVVSVVAAVHRQYDVGNEKFSPRMKAVADFCAASSYQQKCQRSLRTVNSTDPKAYIVQAIMSSQDAVMDFFNFTDSLIVGSDYLPPRPRMALEGCKDLMNLAQESLQAAVSEVDDAQLSTIQDRISDLRTWLSAVISYQQSCLDSFDEKDATVLETMSKGIIDADQISTNALDIVTRLSDILPKFGLQFNVTASRRLLSNEYPKWFAAADRKLLAGLGKRKIMPNAIVAQDGSGQFKTISEALAAYPQGFQGRYVIYVKAGVYDECIMVNSKTTNVIMYGDGPRKTIVTGRKNYIDGVQTMQSATFSVVGNGFVAKGMGFQNTAGPQGRQAVAFRSASDKSAFFNCRFDGYQDTLYAHANRQFYRNCVISGTVDFIFGDAAAVIQNSLIIVRRPMDGQKNTVTAHGKKKPNENTGFVIQNCRIVPEMKLFAERFKIPSYLGRPWKEYSTAVVMESSLGDFIQPDGWMVWKGTFALNTCYHAEYNNHGPGADTSNRISWKGYHVIDRAAAMQFTVQNFLNSRKNWLPVAGIPVLSSLRY